MTGPGTARRLLQALTELDDWSTRDVIVQQAGRYVEQVDLVLQALVLVHLIASLTNDSGDEVQLELCSMGDTEDRRGG